MSAGFSLADVMEMTIPQVDLYSLACDKRSAIQSKNDLIIARASQADQKDYKKILSTFEAILKS